MVTEGGVYAAAVNIGVQPTIPSGKVTVEAHVLEGAPELYGQAVRLIPGNRIRPEILFSSTEALTAQIREDQEKVLDWYKSRETAEEWTGWSEKRQSFALYGQGRE